MIPIFAGFSILKFLGGFNIFNGEKLGKLLFYILIVIGCLALWNKLVAPTHKTVVQEQKITNYYAVPQECNALIRFKLWKILNIGIGG